MYRNHLATTDKWVKENTQTNKYDPFLGIDMSYWDDEKPIEISKEMIGKFLNISTKHGDVIEDIPDEMLHKVSFYKYDFETGQDVLES